MIYAANAVWFCSFLLEFTHIINKVIFPEPPARDTLDRTSDNLGVATELLWGLLCLNQQNQKISKGSFLYNEQKIETAAKLQYVSMLAVLALSQFLLDITANHGLRTPGDEIPFTTRPKIKSQSQIYMYGQSIFCLPHRPKISGYFDLCLHWGPQSVLPIITLQDKF